MRANDELGLKAESAVDKLLRAKFPSLNIRWTRNEGRKNEPFDFEISDGEKTVGAIEVKAFGASRKVEWTQYKRPAIRRKKRRAERLGSPVTATIVVRYFEKTPKPELRWREGFPSIPYERFNPFFRELWEAIEAKRAV